MFPKFFLQTLSKINIPLQSNVSILRVGNSQGRACPNDISNSFAQASRRRSFHSSSSCWKEKDRKYYLQTSSPRDEGTEGEATIGIDRAHR